MKYLREATGIALAIGVLMMALIGGIRLLPGSAPEEFGFATGRLILTYWVVAVLLGLLIAAFPRLRRKWWGAMGIGVVGAFILYVTILLNASYAGVGFFVEVWNKGMRGVLGMAAIILYAAIISGGGVGLYLWWDGRKDDAKGDESSE